MDEADDCTRTRFVAVTTPTQARAQAMDFVNETIVTAG
jgi:hypothetical protein